MRAFICLTLGAIIMISTRSGAAAQSARPPYVNMPMFYIWYTRDFANHKLNWNGGVLETPLIGYYDSRDYDTEYRELKTLAEWGINTACLSWWGPHQDEIVDTICRAADRLRREGYNIWLTAYIEHGFDYANLVANAEPGAMFSHPFERYYARYPHLWATVEGKPYVVIYGRCGVPQLPSDNAGFREYLRRKYGDIAALNAKWGARFADFDAIKHSPADIPGWRRAESALYATRLMQRQWQQVERTLRDRAGVPGAAICADINAFAPSVAGYSAVTRVFGGVHTYNDMGQPEEREIHRFAYARAAQHCGGLFFDHIKARYNDSVHRVPGFIYPPEPFKFERWWIQALLHHSDKVQHPSWNEFWEGSNIEPSFECGKRWVEKNELYSSVLAECMPATRQRDLSSRLCVIFNEWAPFYYGKPGDDLLGMVQALRQLDVPFDLLPEELVTSDRLASYDIIIAPTCGVGLGFNGEDRPVMELLREWISAGSGRKLWLTRAPEWGDLLGFDVAGPAEGATPPNRAIMDVGTAADEGYIGAGWRGREDWGRLAPGAPGHGSNRTIRWTNREWSSMALPTAPGKDHTLAIIAEWHHPVSGTVYVNDQEVGRFGQGPGVHVLTFDVPAAVVGGRRESELDFHHDALWVPAEVGQGGDTSMLGIAVDVVDIAVKGHERDAPTVIPSTEEVIFSGAIFGKMKGARMVIPLLGGRDQLQLQRGEVVAAYSDGSPKYVRARVGRNQVLYDNGASGTFMTAALMRELLRNWAHLPTPELNLPQGMLLTTLPCDDTTLVAVSNGLGEPGEFSLRRAALTDKPAALVMRLDADGQPPARVDAKTGDGGALLRDRVKHYGLYEIVQAPLLAAMPDLRMAPNGVYDIWVEVESKVNRKLSGQAWIEGSPSLACEPAKFTLAPQQRGRVKLTIRTGDFWDWGRRTIRLKVDYGEGRVTFWHFAQALRPADLKLATTCLQVPAEGAQAAVELKNVGEAPAREVDVAIGAETAQAGDIAPASTGQAYFHLAPSGRSQAVRVSYRQESKQVRIEGSVVVGGLPTTEQKPAIAVTNPGAARRTWVELPVPLPQGTTVYDDETPVPVTSAGGPALLIELAPAETKVLRVRAEPGPPETAQAPARRAASELATDLQVTKDGTAGAITAQNSHLRLVLDPRAGGTLSSFVTLARGLDYGAGSFGAEYRLDGRTVSQRLSLGRVRVIEQDRWGVTIEAIWEDERVAAAQVWRLRAYQPFVELSVTVTPKTLPDDAVVSFLNSHLARNDLRRIFPGFTTLGEATGWKPETEAEHFGSKEYHGPWAPPAWAAYMVDANNVQDALAIIPATPQAVAGFRQGFYPERKFEAPGVAKYCDIEVYAQPRGGPMTAQFVIYNFDGSWDKFEELIAERERAPVASMGW
jgi:hypothetical protein